PDEKGAGEAHEGEVVLRLLLHRNEQLPAAVEPGRGAFDTRPGAAPTLAPLLAAPADVRHIPATADGVLGIGIVVTLVEQRCNYHPHANGAWKTAMRPCGRA